MKKLILTSALFLFFMLQGQIAESRTGDSNSIMRTVDENRATSASITWRYNNSIREKGRHLTALYLGLGSDLGYHDFIPRLGIAGSFILSNNWGGSISLKTAEFKARNLPPDYRPGGFIFFGDGIPDEGMTMISLCIMKEFPLSSKLIRFGLEGGPSLVSYDEVHFTPNQTSGPYFFGPPSNYDADYTHHKTAGLALRAKIELPLTRFVGCEFAVNSNLNVLRPFIGAEIHLTLGVVRGRQLPRL
jgi:hypothetical protein